jgi:hypothetical protein
MPRPIYTGGDPRPTAGRRPLWAAVAGPSGDQRLATASRDAIGGLRPAVADHSCMGPPLSNPPTPSFLPLCPQIFSHVVNSSSLAPAHARPAQTSPQNFKHP